MIILKKAPEENGAHANQTIQGQLTGIPYGWAAVPEPLQETAMKFMPWLKLTLKEDGTITAIEENAGAKEKFEAALAAAGEEGGDTNGN